MTNDMYLKIENILVQYTFGNITPKDVKKHLKALGYKVDLRKWIFNCIDVESVETGEFTEIET